MTANTEHLIKTVRKYPVLYDTTHTDYKNAKIKTRVWDTVAELTGESNGESVKNKWKNLRDSYAKHIRSNNLSSGHNTKYTERYKTWPWVEHMTFLRPFLEFSPHSDSSGNPENMSHHNTHNTSSDSRRRSTRLSQVDAVLNYLKNRPPSPDYDDTDLIFLGYSKMIKKFSSHRRAVTKFKIAKIIMEEELQHCMERSSRIPANFQVDSACNVVPTPYMSPELDVKESIHGSFPSSPNILSPLPYPNEPQESPLAREQHHNAGQIFQSGVTHPVTILPTTDCSTYTMQTFPVITSTPSQCYDTPATACRKKTY